MRWLEWCLDPSADDTTFESHYVFLLKEAGGTVRVEYEKHTEGLFARENWRRLFREVGFSEPKIVVDLYDREIFVGIRPVK